MLKLDIVEFGYIIYNGKLSNRKPTDAASDNFVKKFLGKLSAALWFETKTGPKRNIFSSW